MRFAFEQLQLLSPAIRGELAVGDIIVALDGVAVTGVDDLSRLLDHTVIGRQVIATVLRDNARLELFIAPVDREAP